MTDRDPHRLFVLRHAHAAKGIPGQADYDRRLDERGTREAAYLRDVLRDKGFVIRNVIASGSARTRETLAGLALPDAATAFDDALFAGGTEDYLAAARRFADGAAGLIVGHNPMVADFVASLAGSGDEAALGQLAANVPPGSLAVLEFPHPLTAIRPGSGFLRHFVVPPR